MMCCCGCGGKCTTDDINDVFNWCLVVLISGMRPKCRHDNTPFDPKYTGDKQRKKRAGERLKSKAGCVQYRGDWSWHKCTNGMNGWRGEGR